MLSLVPEFGRIPVGSLNTFDIDAFRDAVPGALKACGIVDYKLGLDVSLNQRAGVASPDFWQLQLWGFFIEPRTPWREQLKALLNPNGGVTRPVKVVKPNSLVAAAAYGVKGTFVRRLSYLKTNLHREDRRECSNTRGRHLRGDAWVELMLFLDRIGLQPRVLVSETHLRHPPLQSRTREVSNEWLWVGLTTTNAGNADDRSSRRSDRRWIQHANHLFDDQQSLATPELRSLVVNHVYDLVALALGATRDAAEMANGRGMRAARLHAIKTEIISS